MPHMPKTLTVSAMSERKISQRSGLDGGSASNALHQHAD